MWKFSKSSAFFSILLLSLVIIVDVRGGPPHELVSDGVDEGEGQQSSVLGLRGMEYSSEGCDQTYGFLPCSNNIFGQLFLILVYAYLIFQGGSYVTSGSEQIFEIVGPGVFGDVFQVLGALSEGLIVLASGLSGSTEAAESQVSVGMGMLAGTTVVLLTIIWGSCVIVGKCDLQDSFDKDLQDTKGFSLTGSGVSTDKLTSHAAKIMVISVIPLIIVQLPRVLRSTSGRHLAVLIALIVSLMLLITYFLYQIFQPFIQKRRFAYVKHKHVISGLLKHLRKRALGRLLTEDGEPNVETIRKLFHTIDEDQDQKLSKPELRALIVGIQFEEIDFDENEAVDKVMSDFNASNDQFMDEEEFIKGISKWLMEAKRYGPSGPGSGPDSSKILDNFHMGTKREHDSLTEDQSDEVVEAVENRKWITFKAVMMLLLGTVISAVFADALVDAVDNFSDATSIPTFFISFIALPLATKSREAVSAIISAGRKKKRTTSLTFSELYAVVTVNNTLILSVFLALVYVRGLTWDFSSEVLVILIVCVVMGAIGSFRTTFPLWTSSIALLLYPFSLALVCVLNYVFGWS